MRCWQDGSMDKGPKHDDLNLMDPHGGERKPAPAGCPLISVVYKQTEVITLSQKPRQVSLWLLWL